MPGIQPFSYFNVGHETTRGTPVAPTRQLYSEGTGILEVDPSLNFHETENAGVRTRIRRATQQAEDVRLRFRTDSGIGFDDLLVPFSQLKGAVVPTGAGADKTATYVPLMTAANNPESWSIDVGDDVQNWRIQYGMWSRFKLSAELNSVTQLEGDLFGQRAVKGTKASPAMQSAVKIPGELWTVKFASSIAGLAGASISTNLMLSWDLDVQTGLIWRHYMDGNLYGAQHVETTISAALTLKVESTAVAVSEFYDKWLSQTLDFVRLKATSPVVLGGSAYSAQIDLPILWSNVAPISEDDQDINLYGIQGNLAYDSTSAASIQATIVQ